VRRYVTPRRRPLEITRCPIVQECLCTDDRGHPCTVVVRHQWPDIPAAERRTRWFVEHQVPEPWVGHIDSAPLLYLSSNPSLSSRRERRAPPKTPIVRLPNEEKLRDSHPAVAQGLHAPKPAWTDRELIDQFRAAFEVWMSDGVRPIVEPSGSLGQAVPFWRSVKELAQTILDHPVALITPLAKSCTASRQERLAPRARRPSASLATCVGCFACLRLRCW
jgi:hypothetical protein